MIADIIKMKIGEALMALNLPTPDEIQLEHPDRLEHGDYASNVAMVLAEGENPRELADEIVGKLKEDLPKDVANVSVAGPGFINFTLTPEFFSNSLRKIINAGDDFGTSDDLSGKKLIFEYTTQNLMKEFHVGHLMSHVIGNSVSNLYQASGAEIKRNSYQGDVGMHIAKAVWAIWKDADNLKPFPDDRKTPEEKADYLGTKYAFGDAMYDSQDLAGFSEGKEKNKKEIEKINKKIYEESDPEINKIYEKAREWSLESYEKIYNRLGVKLDWKFFESETGPVGKKIVKNNMPDVFEESKGAVIYDGKKKDDLHKRVFINSTGIPTYEAKDLGLMQLKYKVYPYDRAFVFTANEQNEYFKVVLSAAQKALPNIGDKTTHIGHGELKLKSGKMSSRSGDVLSASDLLDQVKERASKKISDRQEVKNKEEIAEIIAQSAIRYSILKKDPSKDITFDADKALSFEGDSGPYLQYTYARCRSLLKKAKEYNNLANIKKLKTNPPAAVRVLYKYPEVVDRARKKFAPNLVANYLHSAAQKFNTFYGNTKIIGDDPQEGYRLAVTAATAQVLENGLDLLGIETPEEM